jgi:peptidoglycan/LPS O-acetylase OafA/YrhL
MIYNEQPFFAFTNGGDVGVLGFFLFSGFFCIRSASKVVEKGAFKWYMDKIKRLYPCFLLASLSIFTCSLLFDEFRNPPNFSDLIKSLLLIPYFSPTIDGAHWYVFALVRYYIFFSIAFHFSLHKKDLFWIILVSFIILNGLLKRINVFNPFEYFIPMWLDNRMLEGMFLFAFVQWGKKLYLILYILNGVIISTTRSTIPCLLILSIYPFLFEERNCLIKKILKPVKDFFASKPLLFFGSVSYMWYLLHQNIGYAIIRFFRTNYNYNLNFCILIAFLMTLFFSFLLNSFCEKILAMRKKNV